MSDTLASIDGHITRIRATLEVLIWLSALNTGGALIVLWRVFTH